MIYTSTFTHGADANGDIFREPLLVYISPLGLLPNTDETLVTCAAIPVGRRLRCIRIAGGNKSLLASSGRYTVGGAECINLAVLFGDFPVIKDEDCLGCTIVDVVLPP